MATVNLKVNIEGNGTATINGTSVKNGDTIAVESGSEVTLAATPEASYDFYDATITSATVPVTKAKPSFVYIV
jgi:hypothetical protein